MANPTYEPSITALLCIDFYNDFPSEGGKLWPLVKDMAQEVNLLDNLRIIVHTAREAGIAIYHVPHHRWKPGNYVNWKYFSRYQLAAGERQAFAKGTWDGTFHDDFPVRDGDIVVTEHWASSGFPNTDLEHQLKRYGKEKSICVGLFAKRLRGSDRAHRHGARLPCHARARRNGRTLARGAVRGAGQRRADLRPRDPDDG